MSFPMPQPPSTDPIKIVVLDGYTLNPGDNPWDDIAQLGDLVIHDRTAPDQLLERAQDAQILLTNKTPLTAQTLAALPKLQFIGVLATGYNVVDVQAAATRNIPVSNVPEYGTDAVAQFVFASLLSLLHAPAAHDQAIREGQWQACGDFCFWLSPAVELAGKTMGLIGFGRIGQAVGALAHAFGMNVLACSRSAPEAPGYERFTHTTSREQVFAEADIISLHCPQTPQTEGFIKADLLARMKPTAYLINTARGGLVNEADLTDALNRGVLAGAALDVVSTEPITADNPLLTAQNCLLTPHIAWSAREARHRLMGTTAQNIKAFLDGQPLHVVNGVTTVTTQ